MMSIFGISFGLSVGLVLMLKYLFKKMNWLDKPHLYGYQRMPIPYGVGIVFYLVFAGMSLVYLELSTKLLVLLAAGGLLTMVCFGDDRLRLSAGFRLAMQLICAGAVVLAGIGVPAISNPFGDTIVLDSIRWTWEFGSFVIQVEPWANLVAIVWIVFVINAMNWLDGSPGIVSGISTIAYLVLYLLASMNDLHVIDQSNLAMMALILGASTLAFMSFDFHKPKVLMGDSGAMFLGFMIAVLAMFSGGKLATAFIVLAFPILDAAWTIVRRLIKKKSPFQGDFHHFHHELLRAGFSVRQVNLFYYAVSIGFGVTALYLESFGKLVTIALLFLLMIGVRLSFSRGRKYFARKNP